MLPRVKGRPGDLALTIRGLAVTSDEDMRRVSGTAEALGFDSIWLCDHFLTLAPVEDAGIDRAGARQGARDSALSMPLLECWTTLSARARDTQTLRLGTSVLCHSDRPPSIFAKMAATLDVISGGRLELGLGAGWFDAGALPRAGHAFCMGKASSFVALCRAARIPARIAFQQLDCPDKPLFPEEIRRLWGDRKLPWHSLGEAVRARSTR